MEVLIPAVVLILTVVVVILSVKLFFVPFRILKTLEEIRDQQKMNYDAILVVIKALKNLTTE